MNKLFLLLLVITSSAFAQQPKFSTYDFGQDGMELVANTSNETVIISTFNAKMTIRGEIAEKLYEMYRQNKLTTNTEIIVDSDNASVLGKCFIRKREHLTVVDFYYETVHWDNGLTELYSGKSINLIASDID